MGVASWSESASETGVSDPGYRRHDDSEKPDERKRYKARLDLSEQRLA